MLKSAVYKYSYCILYREVVYAQKKQENHSSSLNKFIGLQIPKRSHIFLARRLLHV